MLETIRVQECMTHPAITATPTMSIHFAQCAMHDNHIRHLPVVQKNELVGILSSGDVRRAMPSNATSLSVWEIHALWDKVTVEDAMTRTLVTVKPDTPVLEAVRLLYEHRLNSLPVIDDTGQLVGILTEVDIYLLLLRESENTTPTLPIATDYPVAVLP